MERKEFLKTLGMGAMSVLVAGSCKLDDTDNSLVACFVLPLEEQGPYPYPGGEANNTLNRGDIVGGQTGIPLTLKLSVVNFNNHCSPAGGVSVHIWHCNKDGYYSGYASQDGANGIQDFTGQTWLRGVQVSDGNGLVNFTTIYPGWEKGRATHIHIQAYVNGVLKRTGQLAFPDITNGLVNASPQYSTRGDNPTVNNKDSVFADSLTSELLTVTGTVENGFSANYTFALQL